MSVLSGEFFIRYECVRGRVDIGTLFNIYTVQFVLNTPPLIFSAANQGGGIYCVGPKNVCSGRILKNPKNHVWKSAFNQGGGI